MFEEHHKGRRWAEKLLLMSRNTGAFKPLVGIKLALGGYDEDGLDLNVGQQQIELAKEHAKMRMRVAARKHYDFRNTPGGLNFKSDKTLTPAAKAFNDDKRMIKQELLNTIGRPNIPSKQVQFGSPTNLMSQLDAVSPDSPLHGMMA